MSMIYDGQIMKKILKIAIVAIIIFFIIVALLLVRRNRIENFKLTYTGKVIDFINNSTKKFETLNDFDLSDTIMVIFYDMKLCKKLPVSENFKRKYSTNRTIINDFNLYDNVVSVWEDDEYKNLDNSNESNVIVVSADKKKKYNGEDISTEFYFRYKINDKNELDDLEFLEKYDVFSMSGEKVK